MKLTDNHLMLEINHFSFDTETFTLQLTGKLDSPTNFQTQAFPSYDLTKLSTYPNFSNNNQQN